MKENMENNGKEWKTTQRFIWHDPKRDPKHDPKHDLKHDPKHNPKHDICFLPRLPKSYNPDSRKLSKTIAWTNLQKNTKKKKSKHQSVYPAFHFLWSDPKRPCPSPTRSSNPSHSRSSWVTPTYTYCSSSNFGTLIIRTHPCRPSVLGSLAGRIFGKSFSNINTRVLF